MDLNLNGPRDRAETELGFVAAKATALRSGLLAWADPTTRASVEEERAALESMLEILQNLLESPLYRSQE